MIQSPQFLLSNPLTIDPISSNNPFSAIISRPDLHLNKFHSRRSTITCARTNNKGFLTSQRSKKTLIQLVRFAASNFHHVLPEPLNFVIREFGAGSGGGGGSGGSWNGFRWGGFNGGGGGRRRVNKKSRFSFWGFVAVCCLGLGFWWFNLGGKLELTNDVVLGAICLSMFLVLIRNGCVGEWLLGFCSGGALVGMSVDKKDELKKFVRGFKAIGISRRQRGRRAI